MRFNGDTNGYDIVTRTNDYVGTSNLVYPITEKTRDANAMMSLVFSWILEAYNGWQADDKTSTDFPIRLANLVQGQGDYDIPVEASTIRSLEVLVNGVYRPILPITEEEIRKMGYTESSLNAQPSTPRYYRPLGSSIKVYPPSNIDVALGLRITFDRGLFKFLPTDTTKEPGFEEQFHEVIPVGMATLFAGRNGMSATNALVEQHNDWENKIKLFYSKRYQERYPNVMRQRDYSYEYL